MTSPLENLTPRDLEDRFFKLCHELNKVERERRIAEKTYEDLYAFKDELLAGLTDKAEGKSNAEKERNARLSKDYKDFVKGMHDAKQAWSDTKVEFSIMQRNWETCRSILSSRNVERRVGV